MIRTSGLSTGLSCLIGLMFLGAPAAGQTVGYAHASEVLYRLQLNPGGGDIAWQVAADTDLGGRTGAFALSADGRLFGTSSWWPNDDRLYVMEPSTGDVEFVGPVASGLWADLAFDDLERLWMVVGGELYQLDTSDATATPVALGRDDLLAVGHHAGTLYGIAGEDFLDSFSLIEIDPDAGTSETVVDLQGYHQDACYNEYPTSMAFDDAGGLWVVIAELHGTCILPFITTGHQYYPDPLSGISGPRRHLAPDTPRLIPGLAVSGEPAAVEIPTVSPAGAALLAALVLIAGVALLRRSRNRATFS